jgi:N-acetylglucosamine-6-phosphate deacetylase
MLPVTRDISSARYDRRVLAGARLFDGERFLDDRAVIIEAPWIAAVVPRAELPIGTSVESVSGTLAPGFIDIQVNGGGGVLFNDTRSVEGIAAIGRAHRRFGTTGFLPTFITDTRERMVEAIAAVAAAIEAGVPGVLGIHLEGPFLNPDRVGAHDRLWIREWDDRDVTLLTSLARGIMLVTLAPEVVPATAIARLKAAGVIVSAGHTAASAEAIAAARTAGLTGFTHLFNAMPPLAGREPGPVGAALADPAAWASLIIDLHHVSATSLRAAIAARGFARTILVTDAMPTVGTDLAGFSLQGRAVHRRDGKLVTEEGTLAGSALDMAAAVRNAVHALGLPLAAALHMASRAPAEFLGLGHEHGRIAPGYRANLVLLDGGLNATRAWIGGA